MDDTLALQKSENHTKKFSDIFIFISVFRGTIGSLAQIGLWRACVVISGQTDCGSIGCSSTFDSQCGKLLTARAFMTIGCISLFVSTLLLIICLVQGANASPRLLLVDKVVSFVAFGAGIIGVGTGISFVTYGGLYKVGAAAIVGIIAVIFNLAGAILVLQIPNGYEYVC